MVTCCVTQPKAKPLQMPKIAVAILLALLLIPATTHAGYDFVNTKPDAVCGNVGLYDYGSVVDGPTFYVDMDTRQVICNSGGACRGPASQQPSCQCPKDLWNCPHPDLSAIYERKMKAKHERHQ